MRNAGLVVVLIAVASVVGSVRGAPLTAIPINQGVAAGCYKCTCAVPSACICRSRLNGSLCDSTGCYGGCGVAIEESSPFVLVRDLYLGGRVVDINGGGVSGKTVNVELPTRQVLKTSTDANGYWSMTIDSTSEEFIETVTMPDILYDPDETTGTDKVHVIILKCPAESYCE